MCKAFRRNMALILLLTAGLSAQRYTGHDHGVFHRPPQTSSSSSKHPSTSPANGSKTAPKSAPSTTQQPSQHTAGVDKLQIGSN